MPLLPLLALPCPNRTLRCPLAPWPPGPLPAVIDVIGRGQLASARELGLAVARLGAVYLTSNVTLAAQVRVSHGAGLGVEWLDDVYMI